MFGQGFLFVVCLGVFVGVVRCLTMTIIFTVQ